jgi:hypothetical protein
MGEGLTETQACNRIKKLYRRDSLAIIEVMDDPSSFEAQKKRSNPYQLPGVVEQASDDKKSIAFTLASEESLLEGKKWEPAARGGKKFFFVFFLSFSFLLRPQKCPKPLLPTLLPLPMSLPR